MDAKKLASLLHIQACYSIDTITDLLDKSALFLNGNNILHSHLHSSYKVLHYPQQQHQKQLLSHSELLYYGCMEFFGNLSHVSHRMWACIHCPEQS